MALGAPGMRARGVRARSALPKRARSAHLSRVSIFCSDVCVVYAEASQHQREFGEFGSCLASIRSTDACAFSVTGSTGGRSAARPFEPLERRVPGRPECTTTLRFFAPLNAVRTCCHSAAVWCARCQRVQVAAARCAEEGLR